jgi:ATP-binding protein involved in chromosome partitioning
VADAQGKPGGKTMQVLEALRTVVVPASGGDVVSLGLVKNMSISEGRVRFELVLPAGHGFDEQALERRLYGLFEALPWVVEVEFGLVHGGEGPPPTPSQPPQGDGHKPLDLGRGAGIEEHPLPDVKHVIAVGSGKGGVGKSTISVNLALALAESGARVGLLDADVYGPSVPLMLGAHGRPLAGPEQKIIPIEHHGLRVMSMGFLLAPDQAVVWRGPMIHGVVRQFLADVDWGALDYLIVDLPPGTGDAPLSLAQALPLTAAVVVTTPQEVAASVAQKAMSMFERMGLRILGIIENMSYFICPHCAKESDIFDRGGGQRLAQAKGVPFLGAIPIDMRMRQGGDVGQPVVLQYPQSELAAQFREVARNLAAQVGQSAARS